MGDHLRPLTNDERREALLAGLNDAPSALTGWPDVLEVGYELGAPGRRFLPFPRTVLTPRRIRLTRAWAPYQQLRTRESIRKVESSLQRFAGALQTIANGVAEAASRIVFPRLEVADLSQDDVVKGA